MGSPPTDKTTREWIDLSGEAAREYLIHRPSGASIGGVMLVAFHGAGSDAWGMEQFSGLSEFADAARVPVVYPQGTGRIPTARSWNSGGAQVLAARRGMDDVRFVASLVRQLQERLPDDSERLFAVGMSNGAAMAYRVAIERPGLFAGIVAVGGCPARELPAPTNPTGILHVHGTADTFVPYDGGIGRGPSSGSLRSVEETIAMWVLANGASAMAIDEQLPRLVEDGTRVRRRWYPAERTTADVTLFTIEGGGHTWPGRASPYRHLGKSTMNLDMDQVLARFIEVPGKRAPAADLGFD